MAITHRRPRNTRMVVVSLLVASLTTITVDARGGETGPLAAIGRVGLAVVTPLQEGVATVFRPVTGFFSNLVRAGTISAENTELRARLDELRGEVREIQGLRRENEEFRRQLGMEKRLGFDTSGARVIGSGVSNFEWAIFIDKGSGDGVRLNQPVMTGGALVGRVVKVGPTSSKVMLIIDPDSAVAVRLSSSGETGLVVGRRNQDLRLDLVEAETAVAPGEHLETSGYERGIFPPEIPVGEVSLVAPDPAGLTKQVHIRPFVDFTRLDYVFLVHTTSLDQREEG